MRGGNLVQNRELEILNSLADVISRAISELDHTELTVENKTSCDGLITTTKHTEFFHAGMIDREGCRHLAAAVKDLVAAYKAVEGDGDKDIRILLSGDIEELAR